jgi:hypothetical protein
MHEQSCAYAVAQVAPNGKELLKNINLGMYLGAKIGILGEMTRSPDHHHTARSDEHVGPWPRRGGAVEVAGGAG